MKSLTQKQAELCKEMIDRFPHNLPEKDQSQATISNLMKVKVLFLKRITKDLTMSLSTLQAFRNDANNQRALRNEIKIRKMANRAFNKVRDVFYEIISTLDPEEILQIDLKDLRSMAIERHPRLLIESKGITTLRHYFQFC